jgi:hypothetical protein
LGSSKEAFGVSKTPDPERMQMTASHYDFATLEGPVREALQTWADHVWKITAERAIVERAELTSERGRSIVTNEAPLCRGPR